MNLKTSLLGGLAAVVLCTLPASAVSIRHDTAVANYNALATNALYAASGHLSFAGSGGSFCSGTLIGASTVLTAAHCLVGTGLPAANSLHFGFDLNPSSSSSFAANVASYVVHPNATGDVLNDLALLFLNVPVNTVTPAMISFADPDGLMGTVVGYGGQGTGTVYPSNLAGANDRLAFQNMITRSTAFPGFPDTHPEPLMWLDFDSPAANRNTFGSSTPLALEGITAPGDSGSGLWVNFGSGPVITGVLFGGYNNFGDANEYGDLSIYNWLGSAANRAWLERNGVTDGSVPEPGTLLAGAGLLAIVFYRRRAGK